MSQRGRKRQRNSKVKFLQQIAGYIIFCNKRDELLEHIKMDSLEGKFMLIEKTGFNTSTQRKATYFQNKL